MNALIRTLIGDELSALYAVLELPGLDDRAGEQWVDQALVALAVEGFPGAADPVKDQLRPGLEALTRTPRLDGWPRAYAVLTPGFFDAAVVHMRTVPALGGDTEALVRLVVADADPTQVVVMQHEPSGVGVLMTGIHHRVRTKADKSRTIDGLVFVAARHGSVGLDVVAAAASADQLTLMRSLPGIRALVTSADIAAVLLADT